MAQETHDLGRLYCHTLEVPRDSPRVQLDGTSHEVEEPWRIGRCILVRLGGRALVVGWWGRGRTAEEVIEAELAEIEPSEDELAAARSVDVEAIRQRFRAEERPTRRHPLYEVR